jgi:hypothetical protein
MQHATLLLRARGATTVVLTLRTYFLVSRHKFCIVDTTYFLVSHHKFFISISTESTFHCFEQTKKMMKSVKKMKRKLAKRTISTSGANFEQAYLKLVSCIEQREWDRVLKWGTALVTSKSCTSEHILHTVCRFQPPASVVNAIIRVCALCLEEIDKNGYTALHTAAEWGASPQVIQVLIKHYSKAASMKEYRGKTPLHLYCEKGHLNRLQDGVLNGAYGDYTDEDSPCEVVISIMDAALLNIADEDKDGFSALEYAIVSGADFRLVRTLQKYCANVSKHLSREPWAKDTTYNSSLGLKCI